MYEVRQNKERVSRRIDAADGGARQRKNTKGKTLNSSIVKIYNLLQRTYSPPTHLPENQPQTPIISNHNKADEVSHILLNGNRQDGGKPSVSPIGWDWLYNNMCRVKGNWVRFHILNEKLGGPGNNKGNLIPARHKDNHSVDWRSFEDSAKNANENGYTLYFHAKVNGYYNIQGVPDGFPKGLSAKYAIWDNFNSSWNSPIECRPIVFQPPCQNNEGGSLIMYASELSRQQWISGVGVTSSIAQILFRLRETIKNNSDIIGVLTDYVFQNQGCLEDDLNKSIPEIESAISGRRKKKLTIIPG